MVDFDRFSSVFASEKNYSFQLLHVGLLQILNTEKIDKKVFKTLVLFRILEWFALKDKDWFKVLRDELSRLEFVTAVIILNTELKHVEDVPIKNTP